MKYQFQIPFAESSGPGIKNGYVIAHSIFLGEDQRKSSNIEVIASYSPVHVKDNKTDEPAKEIFCKYKITTERNPIKTVVPSQENWIICLNKEQSNKLNECRYLAIVSHDIILVDNVAYPAIHQIVMSDNKDLESNMHCCHLPQTVSR